MIKEVHVSFEAAKQLKARGFDEPTTHFYEQGEDLSVVFKKWSNGNKKRNGVMNPKLGRQTNFSAPTQQLAMRWLREFKYIFLCITADYELVEEDEDSDNWDEKLYYRVEVEEIREDFLHSITWNTEFENRRFNTYEDAAEAGILYALQNLPYKRKSR